MRICIIGDNSAPIDEGMKKVTDELSKALENHCDVIVLNPLEVFNRSFWMSLFRFQPDIIHYIPGPSLLSFILLKVIKILTRANTVISLTHPDPRLPTRFVSRYLKPDLMLSQSLQMEHKFQGMGCRIAHVPNGVDSHKFHPVTKIEKLHLREKYGIPSQAYVLLHVGNTREERNLSIFPKLKDDDSYVLIVSSTTITGDADIDESLAKNGCIVWNHFIEPIEEIYALADCYIFPTTNPIGAIDHPLSVLEAMASNLPVVTSKYGALPRLFQQGDGLFFTSSDDEFKSIINHIRSSGLHVATRDQVLSLNWEKIATHIANIYQGLNKTSISLKVI